MSQSRLTTALDRSGLQLPEHGRIAVFAPQTPVQFDALPMDRLHVIQPFKPEYDRLTALGYTCSVAPEGPYSAALVFVPRAKSLARALIARAAVCTAGELVIVDGQKSDGVESLLKAVRARVAPESVLSKGHGKLFWLKPGEVFVDWLETPTEVAPGMITLPGVFSADGPDPASRLLLESLPQALGAQVADLGAGWGYVASALLSRADIVQCHLVEADSRALDCARRNVVDSRARFHWADAMEWHAPELLDTVVMNPPFHTGRAGAPDLGRAFIAAAARNLKPRGSLWMVANRHLPYEADLDRCFARWHEVGGDGRFKILAAEHPSRLKRK